MSSIGVVFRVSCSGSRVYGYMGTYRHAQEERPPLPAQEAGFRGHLVPIFTPIMENQMEKKMENEMETGII